MTKENKQQWCVQVKLPNIPGGDRWRPVFVGDTRDFCEGFMHGVKYCNKDKNDNELQMRIIINEAN